MTAMKEITLSNYLGIVNCSERTKRAINLKFRLAESRSIDGWNKITGLKVDIPTKKTYIKKENKK